LDDRRPLAVALLAVRAHVAAHLLRAPRAPPPPHVVARARGLLMRLWPFRRRPADPAPAAAPEAPRVRHAVRSFRGLDYPHPGAEADLNLQIARGDLSLLRK